MSSLIAQPDQIEAEWKSLCLAEYAEFVARSPVPLPCFFLSGSAWFDAGREHAKAWEEIYTRFGNEFWAKHGLTVDWAKSRNTAKLYLNPLGIVACTDYVSEPASEL